MNDLPPITPVPRCACWRTVSYAGMNLTSSTASGAESVFLNTTPIPETIYNPECPRHGQTVTE